jgi:hypothetical protein
MDQDQTAKRVEGFKVESLRSMMKQLPQRQPIADGLPPLLLRLESCCLASPPISRRFLQDSDCHFQGYRDNHVILIKAGGSLIGCFGTMHALCGLVADVSRSTEVHFPSLPYP